MNERPTPETDAEHAQFAMGGFTLDFCRKLERERVEALEDLEFRRGLYKVLEEANSRLREANEEAVALARTLKQERDEARERAAKWESSFDAMERAGAEQARRADENREWALRAERERDEAIADRDILRIDAQREAEHHDRMVGELEKVYKERDEAWERLHKVLKVLDDYDQAIKNPSSPFWEAFKKWFTWEAGK